MIKEFGISLYTIRSSCARGLLILLSVFAAAFATCTPASGAQFVELSSVPVEFADLHSGRCTHKMEGTIESGDSAKFEALLSELPGQDHDDKNFILCMNSSGGSFQEGLRLGALIRQHAFGTYIPNGASCLSACAIAFMHGTVSLYEFYPNFRMLHPRGVLGFHAPALGVKADKDQLVPFALVDSAYSATLAMIAEVARAAAAPSDVASPTIPTSLLAALLSAGTESFVYVDNLHKAFSWKVDIFPTGLKEPAGFSREVGLYQLCDNADYAIGPDSFAVEPTSALTANDVKYGKVGSLWTVDMPPGHQLLYLDNIYNRQCSYLYDSKRNMFILRRYVEGALEREVWLPPVYLFAPATKLSEIAPD